MDQIRSGFIKFKTFTSRQWNRWTTYCNINFQNTNKSIHWLFVILISVIFGLLFSNLVLPQWLGFVIITPIIFLLTNIAILLIRLIYKVIFGSKLENLTYTLGLFLIILLVLAISSGFNSKVEMGMFSLILTIVLQLLCRSVFAIFKNNILTSTTIATALITGTLTIFVVFLFSSNGFDDKYISSYLKLNSVKPNENLDKLAFEKSISNGNHTVKTIEYGTGNKLSLPSTTYDLTPFANNDGLYGMYKEKYQGYTLSKAPIAGKVWYPDNLKACPVLFIVHGNHSITTDSYFGYDYLGKYLASHGYVVVSVDENSCNGLSDENDGRAVLLLENMKQLEKYNNDSSSVLFKKLDYNNLSIGGHSRGGEMVATAYLFNNFNYYPSNGNVTFDYNFNIKSILSISPTVNQYMPLDHPVKLNDVNYLVIHGANDQDVSTFQGMEQYNNINFSGKKSYFKSSLYIAAANHGQFNTLWGKYDLPSPVKLISNTKNFITPENQQEILKIYSKIFLDVTLKKDTQNKDIFYDYNKYSIYLPNTVYIQSYADSNIQYISNFEEDSNLETGTTEGVSIKAYNTKKWTEEMTVYSNGSKRNNNTLMLEWEKNNNVVLEFKVPTFNGTDINLQFDIADMNNTSVANKDYKKVDLEVVITDRNGNTSLTRLSEHHTIYPPLPVRLSKIQHLFSANEYKHQYQTVRIPFSKFKSSKENFDIESITSIKLFFNNEDNGHISIDNVGIGK